jgi:hypothetical protein
MIEWTCVVAPQTAHSAGQTRASPPQHSQATVTMCMRASALIKPLSRSKVYSCSRSHTAVVRQLAARSTYGTSRQEARAHRGLVHSMQGCCIHKAHPSIPQPQLLYSTTHALFSTHTHSLTHSLTHSHTHSQSCSLTTRSHTCRCTGSRSTPYSHSHAPIAGAGPLCCSGNFPSCRQK